MLPNNPLHIIKIFSIRKFLPKFPHFCFTTTINPHLESLSRAFTQAAALLGSTATEGISTTTASALFGSQQGSLFAAAQLQQQQQQQQAAAAAAAAAAASMSKFGSSGDIDLTLPITSTYLRRMRAFGLAAGFDPTGYAKEVSGRFFDIFGSQKCWQLLARDTCQILRLLINTLLIVFFFCYEICHLAKLVLRCQHYAEESHISNEERLHCRHLA